MSLAAATLAALLVAATAPAVPAPASAPAPPPAVPSPRRTGPIESRDEFLLAQPRLTLPAVSPDVLERGETRIRLAADWGSDFGYRQRRQGDVRYVLYFVDGEHRSLSLSVDHGLGDRLTAGARLPVFWRGGGVLDGLIDAWHRFTHLPDSNRPLFPRDILRVRALDEGLGPVPWTGTEGAALGNAELSLRWALGAPGGPGWTTALVGRLQLPTATGSYEGGGVQAGGQLVAAHGLGGSADVYLGLGGTAGGGGAQQGLDYAPLRPSGFLAFEWRPASAVSLLAEANAGGRLIRGVEEFPGLHLTLKVGARVEVARGWCLEAGFTEGLKEVSATTDFGVMVGLQRAIGPRRHRVAVP